MKIRQGFVSNSSTSSFVFLGFPEEKGTKKLDLDMLEILFKGDKYHLEQLEELKKKITASKKAAEKDDDYYDEDEFGDEFDDLLSDCDATFTDYESGMPNLIGKSLAYGEMEQTKVSSVYAALKEVEELAELFGASKDDIKLWSGTAMC